MTQRLPLKPDYTLGPLECGGKRSATPLWLRHGSHWAQRDLAGEAGRCARSQSAVAAALYRRTPQAWRSIKP